MDLLETFVFRIDERPSSELIKMLMEHVTYVSPAKNIETTSLCYPVADDCAIDSTPVIRSFLLQLLLKYRYQQTILNEVISFNFWHVFF